MLRPIYLQPGDKVALISPSGIATKEQLDAACSLLTSWELEPVPGQHVLSRHGRLAGTDEERLHDLQTALDAEDIRAIWCMAGDYGMLRIVQEADFSIFQGNPKWVIGMNDITVLHADSILSGSSLRLHAVQLQEHLSESSHAITEFPFQDHLLIRHPRHPFNRTGIVKPK
ncbi:MAG: LD-carboxypeptidase [Butyricimonas faecalis]